MNLVIYIIVQLLPQNFSEYVIVKLFSYFVGSTFLDIALLPDILVGAQHVLSICLCRGHSLFVYQSGD